MFVCRVWLFGHPAAARRDTSHRRKQNMISERNKEDSEMHDGQVARQSSRPESSVEFHTGNRYGIRDGKRSNFQGHRSLWRVCLSGQMIHPVERGVRSLKPEPPLSANTTDLVTEGVINAVANSTGPCQRKGERKHPNQDNQPLRLVSGPFESIAPGNGSQKPRIEFCVRSTHVMKQHRSERR